VKDTLKKYWGYDSFRPLQEEIIQSVLDAKDTLALLPTGGGKSLCFQVPTMMQEGMCIVITPLVALMEDQVYNLKKKGIKAAAIHSALHPREVDILLNNCLYGDYKFLYIAPERIQSELFWARVEQMNVNLIAVDESHCVSQWGYDFRPSYFKIAALRGLKKEVPVLALTASATDKVKDDIIDKLELKDCNTFRQSFAKPNLQYVVELQQDKPKRINEILSKVPGSALVYCRNRKKTQKIATFLKTCGIDADFYHAGLSNTNRLNKQNAWIKGDIRVMVCTNAFGMGVDKADVRTVIHIDLPDAIEAYYQEAGRAGRDGKRAFAVLLFHPEDEETITEMSNKQFPDLEQVQRVYQALSNRYQIGIGVKSELGLDFDLFKFCLKYNLDPSQTHFCLKVLESEGLIQVSENVYAPSKVQITANNEELYAFQIANKAFANLIDLLVRTYEGVFDDYVKINEVLISNKTGLSQDTIEQQLGLLAKRSILKYIPQKDKPMIWFLKQRKAAKDLRYSPYFAVRQKTVNDNIAAMLKYATQEDQCREQLILNYFDEGVKKNCGRCDWCIEEKKDVDLKQEIVRILRDHGTITISNLLVQVDLFTEKELIQELRQMIDREEIEKTEDNICLKRS
jgi:ATP-dependent DNA helicase RecQ